MYYDKKKLTSVSPTSVKETGYIIYEKVKEMMQRNQNTWGIFVTSDRQTLINYFKVSYLKDFEITGIEEKLILILSQDDTAKPQKRKIVLEISLSF